MPIPAFDKDGFLPQGVHDCTFDEVKARFGAFQGSDRRPQLFQKLENLLRECRAAQLGQWLLVDGSFVTAKTDPNDIDLVLVLFRHFDVMADLPPLQYNLISKRAVQKRFGFDMIAVREESVEYAEAVNFFAQVRGAPTARKGILRIGL